VGLALVVVFLAAPIPAGLTGCNCNGSDFLVQKGVVNCTTMPHTATSKASGTFKCATAGRPPQPCQISHQMELWWFDPNTDEYERLTADPIAYMSTLACDGNMHTIQCTHAAFTLPYHTNYLFLHDWYKTSGSWTGGDAEISDYFEC
jgi:hypothetical protein